MAQNILHMFFTGEHASPFDINMAVDAGFQTVVPYTRVTRKDVLPLVQDSIFSRPPAYFNHTGVFIGGHDVNLAADMVEAAGNAMFKPFEVCVMADPNGAYTTSAATIALVNKHLVESGSELNGSSVAVFGGGPVGLCALVLAARAGARATLARLTPATAEKQRVVEQFLSRYSVEVSHVSAETEDQKHEVLQAADVVVSTAKAGIEVLSADLLSSVQGIKVAADVNAVPPAGIAGVGLQDKGIPVETLNGGLGIGALAIGNIKYKTQQGLLQRMQTTPEAVVLDFPDAFEVASELVSA
ncbi:MAG: methylenetetrahydromethanopterin dehydrogenase [Granulosicoccus sp.]|nr:methylenetetrahydromethanopterin dehydrogenase [Granulosicoccus sp.]